MRLIGAGRARPPRGASPWLALTALCLGFFLLLLDSTIVAVAIPAISAGMGVSTAATVWVNSGYLFAYAVPLLFAGRWGDRTGPRRVYLIGLVLFVAASAAGGLSPTLPLLTLSRIAQGLGAALMTPQTLAIIRRSFDRAALPIALGIWGSVGGVAAAAGPVLGGLLVAWLGWPSIFLANVPLGALAVLLTLLWVPDVPRTRGTIPVATVLLSAAGVFLVVLGIHEAGAWPADRSAGLAAAGAALLVVAFVVQPRAPERALVPALLVRRRAFVLATGAATGASFIVGSALVPIMVSLQEDQGLDVSRSTLALLPLGVVSALTAPVAGRSVARWGARPVALLGALALTGSILGCALAVQQQAGPVPIAVAMGVFGLGNSFVWSPLATTAMTAVPTAYAGSASGAYNATRQGGAVIGSAVVAATIAASGPAASLWVLGAAGVATLVCAAGIPRGAGRTPPIEDAGTSPANG
ncbi:MFS transporter [Microbacterium sp. SORGH_AS_0888]|uniref:MFS transporter n=1 Tax=Microbacterium sp. SORGH_AS_0888 TaxID=3041791 RepID=UPI00278B58E3|nr:MFS transporter [Microbacterium sp. SORGH_AS_0888]MDQ1131304.1 EmrB/QacA subfamily drug resistance transporter [Microbacterium sp. SORGH_AS_0888]